MRHLNIFNEHIPNHRVGVCLKGASPLCCMLGIFPAMFMSSDVSDSGLFECYCFGLFGCQITDILFLGFNWIDAFLNINLVQPSSFLCGCECNVREST